MQPVAEVEQQEHARVDDEGVLVEALLVLLHLLVELLVLWADLAGGAAHLADLEVVPPVGAVLAEEPLAHRVRETAGGGGGSQVVLGGNDLLLERKKVQKLNCKNLDTLPRGSVPGRPGMP